MEVSDAVYAALKRDIVTVIGADRPRRRKVANGWTLFLLSGMILLYMPAVSSGATSVPTAVLHLSVMLLVLNLLFLFGRGLFESYQVQVALQKAVVAIGSAEANGGHGSGPLHQG